MNSSRLTQDGVMLLEALVAILLISFGILGLIALWAASIKGVSEAKYRTDASFLANELIGQMWIDRANVAVGYSTSTVTDWKARVAATLPSGNGSVDVAVDPDTTPLLRTTVTIEWTLPGDAKHTFRSIAQINGAGAM
jgi:type IV pilus assembly protein PilV